MKKRLVAETIIASAIIWGLVILGCSFKLRGTACYDEISLLLFGGFMSHLLLVWAPMVIVKEKPEVEPPDS